MHVERDDMIAKLWLNPPSVANDGGFARRDLNEIERIVRENEIKLMEAWHDYFGN